MQERYLGDVHDFVKFALLRSLVDALGLRLGVNWYRTDPGSVDPVGNNDGEQRAYAAGEHWRGLDDGLRTRLAALDARSFAALATADILPVNTLYFNEEVAADRADWQQRAERMLSEAGLVFLDPDNGFETASRRGVPAKYARYDEAAAWVRNGHAVISIQFARQCPIIQRALDTRARLMDRLPGLPVLPVVRARVAPTLLFVCAAPPEHAEAMTAALTRFAAQKADRLSLIDESGCSSGLPAHAADHGSRVATLATRRPIPTRQLVQEAG